jgi:hypothetical protein
MKKQNNQKVIIVAVIAVLVVLVLITILSGPKVGSAIFVNGSAWDGMQVINLQEEEFITIIELPAESLSFDFRMALDPSLSTLTQYGFTLTKRDEEHYVFKILKERGGSQDEIIDTLYIGAEDSTTVYLNIDEGELQLPDLEISYSNGKITITNLHSLPPDFADIKLYNATGGLYGPVISLNTGETFFALVNASSVIAPDLNASLLNSTPIADLSRSVIRKVALEHYTTMNISWVAPGVSGAVVLDINASIQGKSSHKFYTLAVGSVAYGLRETAFPEITLKRLPDGTGNLTINLRATTQLQNVGLPCELDDVSDLAGTQVKSVYTYDPSLGARKWTNGIVPDDFNTFTNFSGYFFELGTAQAVTLNARCKLQTFQSPGLIPNPLQQKFLRLDAGWNLISFPGIVPRTLADFTLETDFQIFECQQNYQCREIPINTLLNPGKAYWLYSTKVLILPYNLE